MAPGSDKVAVEVAMWVAAKRVMRSQFAVSWIGPNHWRVPRAASGRADSICRNSSSPEALPLTTWASSSNRAGEGEVMGGLQ